MKPGDLVKLLGLSTTSLRGKIGIIIEKDVGPWRWWILVEGEKRSVDSRVMEVVDETW